MPNFGKVDPAQPSSLTFVGEKITVAKATPTKSSHSTENMNHENKGTTN